MSVCKKEIIIDNSDDIEESIGNDEEISNLDDIPDVDEMNFTSKEKYYFRMVDKFFKNLDPKDIVRMLDIIEGRSKISLRLLDWFVTKYASKRKISYQLNDKQLDKDSTVFNVHISYKAQLKSYKKRYFDPFRRNSLNKKKKFFYHYNVNENNGKFVTTIGQLNFFRWVFIYGIIDYVEKNYDTISKSMVVSNKEEKIKKGKDKSKDSIILNKNGIKISAQKIKNDDGTLSDDTKSNGSMLSKYSVPGKDGTEIKIIVSFD